MNKIVFQSMYVFLSALLLAALFVLTPTNDKDVLAFQKDIKNQITTATAQVMGEQTYSEPFALIWVTIDNFYNQSADQAIALLQDDALTNLVLKFNSEYQLSNEINLQPQIARAPLEEPIYNIVPMADAETLLDPYFNEDAAYFQHYGGTVAGESIHVNEEGDVVEPPKEVAVEWVTVSDSITGYPFCVGVFNATVNSYPGACAVDQEAPIYQN